MPASVINATVNGLNATGGNTAGLELQVSGTTAVTIDSSGNCVLANSLPVTSGGTAPTNGSGTTYWQATWAGPVDPRWTNLDQARISYNTGIRSNLNFK